MPRRQPSLFIKPPKMAHGDAGRMTEFSAACGLPLVPWQQDFLNRLETASMSEQFAEITCGVTVTPVGHDRAGFDNVDIAWDEPY